MGDASWPSVSVLSLDALISYSFAFLPPKRSREHALSVADRALYIQLGQGPWGEVSAFVAKFRNVNALQSEHQRKLAAVMQVVGHDTPDGPSRSPRSDRVRDAMPVVLASVE